MCLRLELTKLYDAWLADMAKPVKAGEKRYDMALQTGKKPKKMSKEEKKKARDMERAKNARPQNPPKHQNREKLILLSHGPLPKLSRSSRASRVGSKLGA